MQMKDDDKLDEVKAILRRLQRIGAGDDDGTAPAGPDGPPLRSDLRDNGTPHEIGTSPNRVNSPAAQDAGVAKSGVERPPGPRLRQVAFASVPVLLVVAGVAFTFWPKARNKLHGASPDKAVELNKPQPPPAVTEPQRTTAAIPQSDPPQPGAEGAQTRANGPRQPTDQTAERISYAQRLIDEGKVAAGRDVLLDGLAEQNADAALALARSYDPNSVRLIPDADATADVEQAERWYRRWHEIATSDGLALDAERVDRIIKAMK
jgi:hypothetical protein